MTVLDEDETVRRLRELGGASGGLVVFSTIAASGRPHPSVVNAGVLSYPKADGPVVALVALGGSLKVRHLERDPRAVVVFRDGRRWLAAEGGAALAGPDHPHPDFPPEALPELLRSVYRVAGGGEHPDWDGYDRTMVEGRRVAVLLRITRTYGVYWPEGGAPPEK
jgi:PPOX class probable F420-dependent enzyme